MLLDSNIIIYAAQPEHAALRQFIETHTPNEALSVSVERKEQPLTPETVRHLVREELALQG